MLKRERESKMSKLRLIGRESRWRFKRKISIERESERIWSIYLKAELIKLWGKGQNLTIKLNLLRKKKMNS